MTRVCPVEQAGSHHTHVGGTGRGRAESNAHFGAGGCRFTHDGPILLRETPLPSPLLPSSAWKQGGVPRDEDGSS
ncbi:hypothetical protein HMPREF9004_1738 [Schaalia cardiffensis F0333]|uniref:Uncharacterized protein n=1 Tax=Schaalia cardiffensis F0333 TaxID=888050 RepID=N6X9K9_9ACTO|nr:hypothetical protein HMPREF9004_1738 [Schaalia cardiffensis F0333]